MKKMIAICLASIALFQSACVSAPRATLELDENVSQQIKFIELSHRDLVRSYFILMEQRINEFIDNQWIPSFLDRVVQHEDVIAYLNRLNQGVNIDEDQVKETLINSRKFSTTEIEIIQGALAAAKMERRVAFAEVMLEFSENAMERINKMRTTWRDRLRTSEKNFMTQLDEAYAIVHSGNASLRAYLESVVNVVEAQDAALQRFGLEGKREQLIDVIADTSDFLHNATQRVDQANQTINQVRGERRSDGEAGTELVMDETLDELTPVNNEGEQDDEPDDSPVLDEDELQRQLEELEQEENEQ